MRSNTSLKKPLMAEYFNDDPVVHNWTYKPDKAGRYDSNLANADQVG
jgi:hypothetical protein